MTKSDVHRPRVVIVEDEYLISDYFASLTEEFGAEVVGQAADANSARALIEAERPSHILMDLRLGDGEDGVDIALWAREQMLDTRIIYITGSNEPSSIKRINSDHPYRILIKPINPADLAEALS